MKKKTIIAFFCATLSVCAIYGGLRYTVSSGTVHVAMADIPEEDNMLPDDAISPCVMADPDAKRLFSSWYVNSNDSSSGQTGNCGSTDSSIRNCMKFIGKPVHLPCKKIHRGIQLFPKSRLL